MKMSKMILTIAIAGVLFASCDDGKKKAEEAKAEAEKIEMEANEAAEKAAADAKAAFDNNTIAAIAVGNENFSTLVATLKQAGLVDTFMGEGEFTVFAPTNDAFGKVPADALAGLLKDENRAALQNLLKYHVVAGEFMAADVVKAISDNNGKYNVTTLAGQNLVLMLDGDKVVVQDANGGKSTVVMADVDASNGVIHAIDTVVMPKG